MLWQIANNNKDLHWHIPGAHETSYPFTNLDLGMHFLFPSTYLHTLRLTIKLSPWQCGVQLWMPLDHCLLDPTLWVSFPAVSLPTGHMELPALFFGLKMPSQFGGHLSCPLSSSKFSVVLSDRSAALHTVHFFLLETFSSLVFQDSRLSGLPSQPFLCWSPFIFPDLWISCVPELILRPLVFSIITA